MSKDYEKGDVLKIVSKDEHKGPFYVVVLELNPLSSTKDYICYSPSLFQEDNLGIMTDMKEGQFSKKCNINKKDSLIFKYINEVGAADLDE